MSVSEELFVQCCAPTLAGIKTGSMFSCSYESKDEMTEDLRSMNRLLAPRGLCLIPLRFHAGKALLYLFRPAALRADMQNRDARKLLNEAGYEGTQCGECIGRLIRRLKEGNGFPHEVGLFLSYPPEDVRGFIENHAQNYKFIGYWKVYGDENNARRTFEKYKKCTDSYCRRLRAGHGLKELAVAV